MSAKQNGNAIEHESSTELDRVTQSTTSSTTSRFESFIPASKKQRSSPKGSNDMSDILTLLDDPRFISTTNDVLNHKSGLPDGQTTFSRVNPKTAKTHKKRKKREKTSVAAKVFGIKNIVIDVVKFLSIKDIVSIRGVNPIFNNLFHFKFVCENFNVYFEYSSKLVVDETIKYQICNNILNIVLWYFASLNRTVGEPVFERQLEKESNIHRKSRGDTGYHSIFMCSIKCYTKVQMQRLYSRLSSLPEKLSMNDENGKCLVLPLEEMYKQINDIQEKMIQLIKSDKIHVFGAVDRLILGHLYSIKPIQGLLDRLLLESKPFRNMIEYAQPTKHSYTSRRMVEKYLGTFFTRFAPLGGECLCLPYQLESKRVQGRPNFFAELCMKGDFSLYEKYITTLTKNELRLNTHDIMNGVFAFMVLFMRLDLIENYIQSNPTIYEVNEVLHFTLDPNVLIEYKNQLLKDEMIPLTIDDQFRMDVIKNIDIYHPTKRILMFYKLCYSTHFACSYDSRPTHYERARHLYTQEKLRDLINNLYHSFDYFVTKWHLMQYDDIVNDETIQHKMHNQLKMLIQYFFGFAHLSRVFTNQVDDRLGNTTTRILLKPKWKTISQIYIRNENKKVTICSNYEFIDLMPKDETELKILFDDIYMDNNDKQMNERNVNSISHYVEYPRFDHMYQVYRPETNSKPFHFDAVAEDKVFELFYKVWQIGCDYDHEQQK